MALRDHFRSPLEDVTAWEGFHGGWPMVIPLELEESYEQIYRNLRIV
jgi:hypothetical protein